MSQNVKDESSKVHFHDSFEEITELPAEILDAGREVRNTTDNIESDFTSDSDKYSDAEESSKGQIRDTGVDAEIINTNAKKHKHSSPGGDEANKKKKEKNKKVKEETKAVKNSKKEDTKAVKNSKKEDTEVVKNSKKEEIKAVKNSKKEDTKAVKNSKKEDTKAVKNSKKEETKTVKNSKKEETKAEKNAKKEEIKNVQNTNKEESEKVKNVKKKEAEKKTRVVEEEDYATDEDSDPHRLMLFNRLAKYPAIMCILNQYQQARVGGLLCMPIAVMEFCLLMATLPATAVIIPVSHFCSTPIFIVDWCLCKGLDVVEVMCPCIAVPPERKFKERKTAKTSKKNE